MADKTKIQWCDSTLNPIMGCGGCELFPSTPTKLFHEIDRRLISAETPEWQDGSARELFQRLLDQAWPEVIDASKEPRDGHVNDLTTTNVYHLRKRARTHAASEFGNHAATVIVAVIEESVKCYAAKLHLNRGCNITEPSKNVHRGYAPTFEQPTQFAGRMAKTARRKDLWGKERPEAVWLNGLPRLVFVSDMGDALSQRSDFQFLQQELRSIQTSAGDRHLWLWLTKRPQVLAQFAESLGGMPPNFCAMTTVTSARQLSRVDQLRSVDARVRGLSIEPLWSPIAKKLDLNGIDWVIVGGESGAKKNVTPFAVEWALDLLALCREHGVAFFLKQLGSRPTRNRAELRLGDKHGGNWETWDEDLRVREMPAYFHEFRQSAGRSAEVTGTPEGLMASVQS